MSGEISPFFFKSSIALLIFIELHQLLENGHFGRLSGRLKASRSFAKIIQRQTCQSLLIPFDTLKDLQAGIIQASFFLPACEFLLDLVDLPVAMDEDHQIAHVLVLWYEGVVIVEPQSFAHCFDHLEIFLAGSVRDWARILGVVICIFVIFKRMEGHKPFALQVALRIPNETSRMHHRLPFLLLAWCHFKGYNIDTLESINNQKMTSAVDRTIQTRSIRLLLKVGYLFVGGKVEDVHASSHLAQDTGVLGALALLEGHEGAVALMEGYFVVLEQLVEGFDGKAVSWVGVVLAGLAVAVLTGAVASDELGFSLGRAVVLAGVTVVLVSVSVLDIVGELMRDLGLAGLVDVEFHGVARRKVVDPGSVFNVVLRGEMHDIGLGVGLFLDDLVRDVPVECLRLILIIRNVFGDSRDLLLQFLLLLCVLILFEHAVGVVVIVILLMEGVVVVTEDEAVGVGAEAYRSAEVVQFGLLLVSHLCEFSLASDPLGLDG